MDEDKRSRDLRVSYQGVKGAYSHLVSSLLFPEGESVACMRFEDALDEVSRGESDYAVIPIENAVGGRVADVHQLLPEMDLWVSREHFHRIHHCLLGMRGVKLEEIEYVYSHEQALMQCRKFLRGFGMEGLRYADTAGAAAEVSRLGDKRYGALASEQAAREYDLEIVRRGDVSDVENNVTRFLVMQKEKDYERVEGCRYITSFMFVTRSIPAALYKCLGGFATHGVNFLRLESYVSLSGDEAGFYAEIEGHVEDSLCKGAFKELSYFTRECKVVGIYPYSEDRVRLRGG